MHPLSVIINININININIINLVKDREKWRVVVNVVLVLGDS